MEITKSILCPEKGKTPEDQSLIVWEHQRVI